MLESKYIFSQFCMFLSLQLADVSSKADNILTSDESQRFPTIDFNNKPLHPPPAEESQQHESDNLTSKEPSNEQPSLFPSLYSDLSNK